MNCRLSPGQTPIEILQEIFFRCLPEFPSDGPDPALWHRGTPNNPGTAPLLLCHVCKWWRDVALSSPLLWTTVSVIIRLGAAIPAPQLVSVWLSRTGALPLNLSLYQQNESTANRIVAGHILDIFEQYTPQWGHVYFKLFAPRPSRSLTAQGKVAPMLQQFRLCTPLKFSEQEEKDFFRVFEGVPRLLNLQVSRIPNLSLSGGSSIPIPWRQLTHLTLDYVPTVGTALHVLRKCSNLENCYMKIDSNQGSFSCAPLHLPNLHTLSVNLGFDHTACFLDQLVIPKLVDLTFFVRGSLDQYSWVQQPFAMFLIRSNCHIHRLEVHDTGMNSQEFVACVAHPNLQLLSELVIDDTKDWTWSPFITRVALDMLTTPSFHCKRPHSSKGKVTNVVPRDGGIDFDFSGGCFPRTGCYLPLLERLTIRGSCFLLPDRAIADMVESRWRYLGEGIARLKFVDIELPGNHIEDTQRLKELKGEGLELVLTQQC